jgi:hypothetical protein
LPNGPWLPFYGLKLFNVSLADNQRNRAYDSEAAVDQTPVEGDTAYIAGDERQRHNTCARDQTESDHPFVPYWIPHRSDKSYRDDEMGKGQPVRSICDERISLIRYRQGIANRSQPLAQ